MPPPKKPAPAHGPYPTLLIVASVLVLGVIFAALAINLESTPFFSRPVADPETIQQVPHVALLLGASVSIASAIIISLGSVVLRHMSLNNVMVAAITFGIAGLNVAVQIIVMAIIYVAVFTHAETKDIRQVQFVNGAYQTNGKQFTRETWSCMMGNLYLTQEPWSTNACSEYHYARYLTIIMSNNAAWIVGIAYWPVRSILFKRNKVDGGKA